MKGLETEHRLGQLFDEPMILLNLIIQVFDLQYLNQIAPAGQEQQHVHVEQSGFVGATFIDNYSMR